MATGARYSRKRRFLVSSIDEVLEKDLLQSTQLRAHEEESSMKQELIVYTGLFLLKSPERKVLIQRYGVDTSRFSAVGLGLGLEWLSMIRYGIEDIRAVQSLKD
jgi:hypothetical protein